PAECFFVLLSGTITLSRMIHGDDIETTRTDQRGAYAGATQAYLRQATENYTASMRAISDSTLLLLPATEFGALIRTWFPMAIHLLDGLFFAMRNQQAVTSQRERMVALGSLAAGLMHELNNPAAAAVRATSALRERVAGMRHKLGMIADGRIDPAQLL